MKTTIIAISIAAAVLFSSGADAKTLKFGKNTHSWQYNKKTKKWKESKIIRAKKRKTIPLKYKKVGGGRGLEFKKIRKKDSRKLYGK